MSRPIGSEPSRAITWAWSILNVLAALPLVLSSGLKLAQAQPVVQSFAQAGLPRATIVPIGILELACILLYLMPKTAVLGAFLLTGYLGGAIVTNLILHAGVLLPAALGLVIWVSAWLRVPQLRTLLPLRHPVAAATIASGPASPVAQR